MTITPNQARELLHETTPAPWKAGHRTLSTGQWYDREILTVEPDVCEDVNEADQELIVAAPAMAALIGGMTREYALQVQTEADGPWLFLKDSGTFTDTPRFARWHHYAYNAFEFLPASYRNHPKRIASRLVSTPEVAE